MTEKIWCRRYLKATIEPSPHTSLVYLAVTMWVSMGDVMTAHQIDATGQDRQNFPTTVKFFPTFTSFDHNRSRIR